MKKIFGRLFIIVPALLLQGLWYIILLSFFAKYFPLIAGILAVLSVLLVLFLVSEPIEPAYKIMWVMLVLMMPIFGTFLYLLWGNKRTSRSMKRKLYLAFRKMKVKPMESGEALDKLRDTDVRAAQTFEYVSRATGFPVVGNASAEYYPLGEDMFEAMREELKKAEKFIFLEYFIIEDGEFLRGLVDILAEKAAAGVDVRILYDDLGCISTMSAKDFLKLSAKKIKCAVFNPLVFVSAQLNNRDHRKIMVIDGKTAFSGGINIADEYINRRERFGHWKDIGFKVTGRPAAVYTYMFMQFWNVSSVSKIPADYLEFTIENDFSDGYALSYYDSPFSDVPVSNDLFIEMLSQATDRVYFYTPYLMLGDTLMEAFVRAARRGVDVRIIMPGIPDKKMVYRMSRSYYRHLLEAGVRIFEYTPGFLHAKACVCDGKLAVIGTVNLDYRSLFLHFECSTIFYGASMIADLERDIAETQARSTERTIDSENNHPIHRIINSILRLIAPLC